MTNSNDVIARIKNMIDEGRLTADQVPDDFDWLKNALNDHRSDVLLDCTIRDWRCAEHIDIKPAHKTEFRLVIEGSEGTGQVWFKIYPKVIDEISSEIPLTGLSGVMEVRNGQPAISLGVDNDENCLHVESDGKHKLFVHTSQETPLMPATKFLDTHGMNFVGVEVEGAEEDWFEQAREEIANKAIEEHMSCKKVTGQDGWTKLDDTWSKCVCIEYIGDDEAKQMLYTVIFVEGTLSVAKCDVVPVSVVRSTKTAAANY